MNETKTAIEALREIARQVKFGEIPVTLIVYNGKITGFDRIIPAKEKFRENASRK